MGVNTSYIYVVGGSRLLNVRLDEHRLRKARRLREQGVPLSDLVREAIDARFEAFERSVSVPDVAAAIARIHEEHPDPPGLPARTYDVHDRAASRRAIVRRLKRRQR